MGGAECGGLEERGGVGWGMGGVRWSDKLQTDTDNNISFNDNMNVFELDGLQKNSTSVECLPLAVAGDKLRLPSGPFDEID